MRILDFVERYAIEHDVRAGTISDYRVTVVVFTRSQGVDTFTSLMDADISEHLAWLKDHGYSPATIRGRRAKLLVLWRAAYAMGYTDNRPDPDRIRKVKVPPPNPQGLTREQTQQLVAWCRCNMRRRLRSVPVSGGDYLAALYAFMWDSAMRLGDALDMQWEWIGPTVTWRQSKTSRWCTAKISSSTLELLERIRVPGHSKPWPRSASSRTSLYAMIRRSFRGAGLTGTSKWLRRGAATDVFERGLDPGRALGHVPGSRVALRYYVSQEAQIEPVSPREL